MNESSGFYNLGIAPSILAVLDKLGFKVPTPIQEKSIATLIEGKDLVGIAQTGTGKTLAFGLPLIQAALRGKQGLVVVPTRELAFQVNEVLKKVGASLGVRTSVIIGGEPIYKQIRDLRRNPQIIVGTPGRIIDHMEQRTIVLKYMNALVLDEADRMFDMGFAPQLKKILEVLPKERQTMLFSATMPENILNIAKVHMKLPTKIEIAVQGTTADRVTQEVYFVGKHDKAQLLETVLRDYRGSILIFSRTKHGARKVATLVRTFGYQSSEIHSDRSLSQRKEALDGFRNGKYRILVATDIAARGIDVKGIELVVNYDMPQNSEDYVHRIGRTARAGGVGHAISFATPDQKGEVRDIEKLIRAALPLAKLPESIPAPVMNLAPIAAAKPKFRHFGGRRSGAKRFRIR